jgi:hypothetical protein
LSSRHRPDARAATRRPPKVRCRLAYAAPRDCGRLPSSLARSYETA